MKKFLYTIPALLLCLTGCVKGDVEYNFSNGQVSSTVKTSINDQVVALDGGLTSAANGKQLADTTPDEQKKVCEAFYATNKIKTNKVETGGVADGFLSCTGSTSPSDIETLNSRDAFKISYDKNNNSYNVSFTPSKMFVDTIKSNGYSKAQVKENGVDLKVKLSFDTIDSVTVNGEPVSNTPGVKADGNTITVDLLEVPDDATLNITASEPVKNSMAKLAPFIAGGAILAVGVIMFAVRKSRKPKRAVETDAKSDEKASVETENDSVDDVFDYVEDTGFLVLTPEVKEKIVNGDSLSQQDLSTGGNRWGDSQTVDENTEDSWDSDDSWGSEDSRQESKPKRGFIEEDDSFDGFLRGE